MRASKLVIDFCFILVAALSLAGSGGAADTVAPGAASPVRRVNVPFDPELRRSEAAIFWFGEVTPANNYADVRITHNDELLQVAVQIFDQWLWRDANPTPAALEQWDAATVYLNLSGNARSNPGQDSYRFVAQLSNPGSQSRDPYQATYRGDGTSWTVSDIPFTTYAGWRGNGFNDGSEARGWNVVFQIPFASLGLPKAPTAGEIWGLAVAVHDRDDAAGTTIPDQVWPENMVAATPGTWGQLHFRLPSNPPVSAVPEGTAVVRHGLDGATVVDAHVGGHTTCAQSLWPEFFSSWGSANYAGYEEVNIQNQWDVADWPCFSKYYVAFPLDALPADKTIIRATLTLYQFGNAGQDWEPAPEPSLIQVVTVADEWDEASITWNNAPLATENVSAARVEPFDASQFPGWPGVPREWDVSLAVAQAYELDMPLQLALYSADTAYHSGKYFVSSDAADWNAAGRPTLTIVWGKPLVFQTRLSLPLITR